MLVQTSDAKARLLFAGVPIKLMKVTTPYNKYKQCYEEVSIVIYMPAAKLLPLVEQIAAQGFAVIVDTKDDGTVAHISVYNSTFAGYKAGEVSINMYETKERELKARWSALGLA